MDNLRSRRTAAIFRLGGVFTVGAAIWFWPLGAPRVAPSFDCATATSPTEKAICADPELARIDADYAVYYQDNLQAAETFSDMAIRDTLMDSEREFLTARNLCGTAKWCIERIYANRSRQLADVGGEAVRATTVRREPEESREHLGAYLIKLLEKTKL